MISATRTATCHPERQHLAKGLCESCYRVAQRKRLKAKMSGAEREAQREKEREYHRVYRSEWRKAHPERERENQRRSQSRAYKADPIKHRNRVGAARYGISVEEYAALRERCRTEPCAACAAPGPLEIDHCHETGLIRGLLCHYCNSALGHARDDIQRLSALIRYLGTGEDA